MAWIFDSLEQHTIHTWKMSDKITNWCSGELEKAERWNPQLSITSSCHLSSFFDNLMMSWEHHRWKQQLAVVWRGVVKRRVFTRELLGKLWGNSKDEDVAASREYWAEVERLWSPPFHGSSKGLEYEGKDSQFGRAQRAKVSAVEVGNNLLLYQWRSCMYRGNVGLWIGDRMI